MSNQVNNDFLLDLTGENEDNLIVDEIHSLNRQKNIVIAPVHGAFYVDTLKIIHVESGYQLRRNIDFKILQPYTTLSAASGKSVAGIILIHNSIVHQNLNLTYQCVGGHYSKTSDSLKNYFNKLKDENPRFSWYNTLIEDEAIKGDIEKIDKFDFHFLCYLLEKIRNTIIWSDNSYYEKIRTYLDQVLKSIETQTKLSLDAFVDREFRNLKQQINKTFINLSNVENLDTATRNDIEQLINPESRIVEFEANKYITLNTLFNFKELLYQRFASSTKTNIGFSRGFEIHPKVNILLDTLNGSVSILKSKKEHTENNIQFDANIYPPLADDTDVYTVMRISNNTNNRGGLFLYSERSGKNIYLVYKPTDNYDEYFNWYRLTTESSLMQTAQDIADHIVNTDNPHGNTKEDVGLGLVENLTTVTHQDIMCLQSCRKYMTVDALMLFFKTYMVNTKAAAEDPRNNNVEKVQVIYTGQAEPKCMPVPCPCPEPEAPAPPPPVAPPPAV